MKLKITITMDNAAFEDSKGFEAARILTKLADKMQEHSLEPGDEYPLIDINGNRVGEAKVTR
jgi:hypothetical protein